METLDYTELQRRYGGRYVARRGDEVIADAESYDRLTEQLDKSGVAWDQLIIEYIESPDSVGIY